MLYLLSHMLDNSAERHPQHDAMRCNGEALTYAELLRRANALAYVLRDEGVKKGDRVGIFLNKSVECAVAIYGIWKAGAAYVPLDPLAPVARLTMVLNDCGARHLVTHESKCTTARALVAATQIESVIGLGDGDDVRARCVAWRDVNALDVTAPVVGAMELDLAYVMYTSGSTGAPKGLMHTHFSGLSYAKLSAETYDVRPHDRLANHSPLHFDMSTFEFFSGPLRGATTIIIPESFTKLPASLSKLLEDERVTVWYSVPYALIQLHLRGALEQRDLSALRWVNFGGEPFPPKHLVALMKRWPHARFSNVYGPAEVNQCSYFHLPPISADNEAEWLAEQAPIGKVWGNAEALVLDDDDTVVDDDGIGELVVRTPTMMRGYWARPDLNAKAFYRRRVFGDYEDVFYRTGDLVQARPDGELKFLGRKDRQIKARGHRIELDEIETALSAHADVEECAVFAVPNLDGTNDVRAAAVLRPNATADAATLRAHLASVLPAYAVPARVDLMPTFPRTGSGKIDRRALRDHALQPIPS